MRTISRTAVVFLEVAQFVYFVIINCFFAPLPPKKEVCIDELRSVGKHAYFLLASELML